MIFREVCHPMLGHPQTQRNCCPTPAPADRCSAARAQARFARNGAMMIASLARTARQVSHTVMPLVVMSP